MPTSPPIAIVGMSSLFAGSHDLLGFWRDIVSATDRLTDVPPHAWLIEDYYDPDPSAPDMTYVKRGGYLDPVPFNPMEFGLPPTSIPATDTAQLLALVAAKRVLEDAGRFSDEADHSRTSVILGVASATELVVEMGSRLQHPIWRKALRDAGLPESRVQEIVRRIKDHYQPWQESTFPGLLGNVVAGRIANRLNLGGSNFVTDAACASSISALQAGLHELYLGDSDMVIAGGVDALNDILMYMCFSKTPAFSPTGDVRPFSEDADGTLIGEGVGMMALRRLEDAEADGDPIYAVVRGLGASSDGKGSSVYAPRPGGQARALKRAYEKADYSPSTVELVEAHGTATKAGDAAEVRGLTSVFGPEDEDGSRWCALGSVKSQIGHTKAAAGSAGLIKVALALHHRILPPTLKVSKPNPKLGLEGGPFYINTEARPWIRGSDHPRRGSVSSFGFGGSNFHVTLEEYTGQGNRPERLRAWPDELVVLSAGSPDELTSELEGLHEEIAVGQPLARIAHDCAAAFEAGAPARVALVASSLEELDQKAARAREAIAADATESVPDADIHFGFGVPERGRLAFVFPGQGSQYVGMGSAAAIAFDDAREVWDAAADMEELVDERLDRAVFPPPAFTDEERLAQQRRLTAMATAQPAIAAMSLGYLRLLRRLGVEPEAMAGHSFGELTALAAAGRIDESELLATARRRGELMAEAADNRAGAMLALPTDRDTVAGLMDEGDDVVIANDNAPTEVVVAGPVEAIDAFAEKAKSAGLRSVRLPVASAFHSEIVADSRDPFHEHLSSVTWGEGRVDVFANKTADRYPESADEARSVLADQLVSSVRFREMVDAMYDAGVTHFVEVGPGRVLTKLIGRCLGDREHVAIALDDKKGSGLRPFWRGLGALAASGVQLELNALSHGYRLPDEPAEAKPFEVMITGFNHDRPYPPEDGAAGLPAPNPEVEEQPTVTTPSNNGGPQGPTSRPGGESVAASAEVEDAPGREQQGIRPASPPADAATAAQVHHATIEAHRRYQELMAESHRQFLDMASEALRQAADGGVAEGAVEQVRQAPAAAPQPTAQVGRATKQVEQATEQQVERPAAPAQRAAAPVDEAASSPTAPAATPAAASSTGSAMAGASASTPGDSSPADSSSPTGASSLAADSSSAPGVDVTALALEVVSEKTGYPVEMLDLDMEMEAGLGIDSIKQVEILSELQERLPELPEIAPSELAELRTLRDVAEKLSGDVAPVEAGAEDGSDSTDEQEAASIEQEAASVEQGAASIDPTEVSAFVPTIVRELRPGFGLSALSSGATVEVTNELPSLAADLVEGLTERGVAARVVETPTASASAVISLAGLGEHEPGPEGAVAVHAGAIQAARLVAQSPEPSERLFVTVQSTGGHFGLAGDPGDGAWTAGLAGIVKTAAREWPGASLKAIDVADPTDAVEAILDELFLGGPALEVGISEDGERSVVQIEPLTSSGDTRVPLEEGSVVVVSGGARGVTASSVTKLAERWGVRLALLGRSELVDWPEGIPVSTDSVEITGALAESAKARGETVDFAELQSRAKSLAASAEVRLTLADLDSRGVDAMYLSADVTKPEEVDAALEQVRQSWGSIDGIVHGAGVLRDKAIADMTPDRVADVFGPKVTGLSVLLEATKEDPIQVIALFSSIAARAGNAGQSAYSAANEVLNKIASAEAHRRGEWCRVRSYNWGPWAGGMVDEALAAHFEKQGIALLDVDLGSRFFVDELSMTGDGVERVVLAAPSFPAVMQSFTLSADEDDDGSGSGSGMGPGLVADFALRLGQALKPVRTMRTYLEDFVSAIRDWDPTEMVKGKHTVEVHPIVAAIPGYRLIFKDSAGNAHHETMVRYSDNGASAPPEVPSAGMEPWPFEADAAYEKLLGSGRLFRSIETLEGVSEEGGMALVRSAASLGWPPKALARGFDPAAFEGLIQLGELWAHHKAGAIQKLARMGSVVVHHLEAIPERLRSAFRARKTEKGTLFDFILATEEGDLVAELREVQFDTHGA